MNSQVAYVTAAEQERDATSAVTQLCHALPQSLQTSAAEER
jgi:hypothetical protein